MLLIQTDMPCLHLTAINVMHTPIRSLEDGGEKLFVGLWQPTATEPANQVLHAPPTLPRNEAVYVCGRRLLLSPAIRERASVPYPGAGTSDNGCLAPVRDS